MKLIPSYFNQLLLSLLLPFILLSGCASKKNNRADLIFWAIGNEGENVQKLLPEFERQNPTIHVVVQQIPWIAAHEKLLTAYAGNSLPDMCQLGNTWVPEFSMLGTLEPLNSYVVSSPTLSSDHYFTGIWNSNVVDSVVYGIPWYVDTRVLFYRKDILASVGYTDPPKTWDELKDVSEKIVHSGEGKKRYAIFLPTNEWVPSIVFGLEAGSTLLKENQTRSDFSGEKFKKGYSFLRSFYLNGLAPSSMTEIMNVYQGFAEGYFSMYISGPWQIGEFSKRLPKELEGKWMTAPLPGISKSSYGLSLPGGSSFAIFKNSQRKTEAWKLIEFLSDRKAQLEFYSNTGNLPARREAWSDSSFANNPLMKAFFTQFNYVKSPAKIPEWEQIAQKVQDLSETAAHGDKSDDEILKVLDEYVNKVLEKRRWMLQTGKIR